MRLMKPTPEVAVRHRQERVFEVKWRGTIQMKYRPPFPRSRKINLFWIHPPPHLNHGLILFFFFSRINKSKIDSGREVRLPIYIMWPKWVISLSLRNAFLDFLLFREKKIIWALQINRVKKTHAYCSFIKQGSIQVFFFSLGSYFGEFYL